MFVNNDIFLSLEDLTFLNLYDCEYSTPHLDLTLFSLQYTIEFMF